MLEVASVFEKHKAHISVGADGFSFVNQECDEIYNFDTVRWCENYFVEAKDIREAIKQ